MDSYGNSQFKIDGVKELERLFEELPKQIVKKGLRQAMNAGATPIAKDAKERARKKSGFMAKAIAKKVKLNASKGTAFAVIGVNSSKQTAREVHVNNALGRVLRLTKNKIYRPSRVLHLVEKGHAGPRPAPAHPFIKPAFDANKDQATEIIADKLKTTLESEAAKLGKR